MFILELVKDTNHTFYQTSCCSGVYLLQMVTEQKIITVKCFHFPLNFE